MSRRDQEIPVDRIQNKHGHVVKHRFLRNVCAVHCRHTSNPDRTLSPSAVGSGFRLTGINFEGPAPRPLERAAISLADDGQLLIDKSRRFQFELGQWQDPDSFLDA